jgi:spermidine/putrescine transport system permease protein
MKIIKWSFVTAIFAWLYLPIVILVINSFNDSKYGYEWKGFTWKWYGKLFANEALTQAFLNSLLIAGLAATAATLIGTLMALALHRYRFPLKGTASGLLFIVMMSPDIVLAITFLVIFIALGIQLGFWSLLIAHITFCLPFVVITVLSLIHI